MMLFSLILMAAIVAPRRGARLSKIARASAPQCHQADEPRGRRPRGRVASIRRRRDADAAPEQVAEAPGAREADLQAGVGDGAPAAQQFLRPRETHLDPVLVR